MKPLSVQKRRASKTRYKEGNWIGNSPQEQTNLKIDSRRQQFESSEWGVQEAFALSDAATACEQEPALAALDHLQQNLTP
eukprot:5348359-Amphidinium_carterae.1